MQTTEQAPGATAAAPATPQGEAVTIRRVVQGSGGAGVAGATDNLSGAQLAAAFSRSRRARRERTAPTANTATTQPEAPAVLADGQQPPASPGETTGAEPAPAETPPAETPAAPPAESNAASASESQAGTASEAVLADGHETPAAAAAEPGEPAEPKGIREMRERIDGLTARLREAERERDEARAGLATTEEAKTKTSTTAPLSGDEFPHDPELQQIRTDLTKWQRVDAWLRENPEGGTVKDAQGRESEITAEQARRLRLDADEALDEGRAQKVARTRELRSQSRETRTRTEQFVEQRFPWTKDATSKGAELLRAMEQRAGPMASQFPDWKLWACHAVESFMRDQAAGQRTAGGTPNRTPPKVAVPAGAAAPRVDPLQRQLAEAEAAFEKTGRPNDYKRVVTLRRQVRERTGRQ